MNNKIYGRFQQKHDIEDNWLRAVNFAPLAGEVIIYDADYDAENNPNGHQSPRIKIGIWDGNSEKTPEMLVNNLPFLSAEAAEEYLKGLSISEDSAAFTETSIAGVKGVHWFNFGYYYSGVTYTWMYFFSLTTDTGSTTPKLMTAEETQEWAKNFVLEEDLFTVHGGSKFDKKFVFGGAGDYSWYLPGATLCLFTNDTIELVNEYGPGMDFTDNAIFCPSKPVNGFVDFGKYAFATGHNVKASNYAAISIGRDNEAYGQYSAALGRNNLVGYAGFAAGRDNNVTGESSAAFNLGNTASGLWSFAGGYHSEATEQNTFAFGQQALATSPHAIALGLNNKANGSCAFAEGKQTEAGYCAHAEGEGTLALSAHQHVQGKFNTGDDAQTYAHIIGGGNADDDRKNIHTVDWSGNAWYAGDVGAGVVSLKGTNETAIYAKDLAELAKARADEAWNYADSAHKLAASKAGLRVTGNNEVFNDLDATNRFIPDENGWIGFSHIEGYGLPTQHYIEASNHAHLEGANNRMSFSSSAHVGGEGNYAKSSANILMSGSYNTAENAQNAFVSGSFNTTTRPNAAVFGTYNMDVADALLMIGNGFVTSDGTIVRQNALTIYSSGVGYIGNKKIVANGDESIQIGNTTLTENELKKILDFIDSIGFKGGNA